MRRHQSLLSFAASSIAVLAVISVFASACGGDSNDDSNEPTLAANEGTPEVVSSGDLGVLESQRPDVGKMAPDFQLKDARTGDVRKLSEFRGKVIVLNWFASWCNPCEREIPSFQALYDARGNEVVVLALDYLESAEKATGMLDELKATFPALLDSEGKVARHYRVSGLPVTYFIDAKGVVQAVHIGEVHADDLEEGLDKAGIKYDVP